MSGAESIANAEQEMRKALTEFTLASQEDETDWQRMLGYAYELAESVKGYLFEVETGGEFS